MQHTTPLLVAGQEQKQRAMAYCNTPQQTATHRNTTQCNTLQHCQSQDKNKSNVQWLTAAHRNKPQHTATQHNATHCNTARRKTRTKATCNDSLQHTATHRNTPQHNANHCNTLQHNTMQHTATLQVAGQEQK